MPTIQAIAKSYLQQGLNVIPVLPELKKPSVAWMEFNDRIPNPLEIQSWFAGKTTNIGIVTGNISKIIVIDIDKPELFSTFISKYPTHRIQRTASGGYHLLYRYEGTDIGNSVSRLASGIDVRGNHGYIVTYPSTVRLANGTLGEYHWQENGEISPLPKELHDTIVQELSNQTKYDIQIQHTDAKDLFYQIVSQGFTPGKHNEQIKDTARYLFRTGMENDAILNLLTALNAKDSTPLPPSELFATINSGIKYEKSRLEKTKDGKPTGREVFDAVDATDLLMRTDGHEDEWLIEEWLPKNSLLMIAAPPENYKTWVALEMAVQVALGDNSNGFLGGTWQGPKVPQPVLIIQQEDQLEKISQRYRTILREKGKNAEFILLQNPDGSILFDTVYGAPIRFHTKAMLSFDDEQSIKELEQKIVEYGIKLVVIDPLYSLGSADDFFAGMARQLLPIKALREKYGVTFVIVHHSKKGTKNSKTISDIDREGVFGSQLLNGAFEGMLLINTLSNGERVIIRKGKAFDGDKEAWGIKFDISTSYYFNDDTGEVEPSHYSVKLSKPNDNPLEEGEEKLRDALAELIEGTKSEIITAAGLKPGKSTYKYFDKLINLGIAVVKDGKKKNGGQVYEFAPAY